MFPEHQVQIGLVGPGLRNSAGADAIHLLRQGGQCRNARQQAAAVVHANGTSRTNGPLRKDSGGVHDSDQCPQHLAVGRPIRVRESEEGRFAVLRRLRGHQGQRPIR